MSHSLTAITPCSEVEGKWEDKYNAENRQLHTEDHCYDMSYTSAQFSDMVI